MTSRSLRPIAAALAAAALSLPLVAGAQTPPPAPTATVYPALQSPPSWTANWMVGLRGIGIYPNDDSSIPGVSVDSAWTAELDFTYFFNPNLAVELIAATAKHAVDLNGSQIGKVGVLPLTLTLQYHFTQFGAFKPYVGAGLNYTFFYDRDLANDTLEIGSGSFGAALQGGVDYMLGPPLVAQLRRQVHLDRHLRRGQGDRQQDRQRRHRPEGLRHRRALPVLLPGVGAKARMPCAP